MARLIADCLEGELDVVLVHKIGAPGQREFAVGSVSEDGRVYLSEVVERYQLSGEYIEREAKEQVEALRRRRATYTPVRPPIPVAGRIVIVVDDGVATGWTLTAALRTVRALEPARLIAALAVAPPETFARLAAEADEIVCLDQPEDFFAVGQFFEEFPQVTDAEVIEALRGAAVKGR
jgi:predicted phosphoribosyltransferase